MKKIIMSLTVLASTSVFASPAVLYSCIGTDSKTQTSVAFELLFSDHDGRTGYTNESITITKRGYEDLSSKPVVFQMRGANKKNHCMKVNGEIMLNGKNFDMSPSKEVDGYVIKIKSDCVGAEANIKAICIN